MKRHTKSGFSYVMSIFFADDGTSEGERVSQYLGEFFEKTGHFVVDRVEDCDRVLIVPTKGWMKSKMVLDYIQQGETLDKWVVLLGDFVMAR